MNLSFLSSLSSIAMTYPNTDDGINTFNLRQDAGPNREPVRVVLTGSRAGITSTIHLLYSKGFGHPNLWSPLLRTPSGDQLYSVFTRWINRGRDSKETSKE